MKITEEQIEELISAVTKRIDEANTLYLQSIGNSIKRLRNLTPSQAHQLIQILKYGGSYEEIISKIKRLTGLSVKEIENVFSLYAKKDQQFYKQFYEFRNIPFVKFENNIPLQRQTKALANIAKKEMYNFARTNVLGYTVRDTRGKLRFMGLREVYNQVLDTALLNVGQGKETFDTAMKNIMNDLGTSGIKTLNYESGRSVRLDSAVRMHLNARLTELHNENQELIGKEFGADGKEITVHDYPAPDHEKVQGRQFSTKKEKGKRKSEWDKLQDGEIAKDYEGRTYTLEHDGKPGYRPIGEINCKHYTFNVILGVSEPSYSDKQLREIIEKNEKGFEYKGKHYTKYEGVQKQRRIELEIRKQKDIYILARESGNEEQMEASRRRIRALQCNLRNLTSMAHIPIKPKRSYVPGYSKTY